MDPADTKQFIIARVIAEAEVEQVNLSEVEKKMLQFTEAERATQDMTAAVAEFERSCDSDEYESKCDRSSQECARPRPGAITPTKTSVERFHIGNQARRSLHSGHDLLRVSRISKGDTATHRICDSIIYITTGIALALACVGFAVCSH
jgi:hypothetical protein